MSLAAPSPYPDELISSAIIRCFRLYGLTPKLFRRHVLEVTSWQPRFLGAASLPALSRLYGLPPARLLWSHTQLPYAVAFFSDSLFARTLGEIARDGTSSNLGAVLQNALVGGGYRRFCKLCAKEDLQVYGESFWRRAHNLPGVEVCARHRVHLHTSSLSVSLSSRLPLELPQDCAEARVKAGRPRDAQVMVAEVSAELLATSEATRPGKVSAARYREMAVEAGLLESGRTLSSRALEQLLAKVFGAQYLQRWSLHPDVRAKGGWAPLLFRDGVDVPFAPIKHILLHVALCPQVGIQRIDLSHRPSGPSPRSLEAEDRLCSQAARKTLDQLRERSVRDLTTEQFLIAAGCWAIYRHNRRKLPLLRCEVLRFRASEVSAKRLGRGKKLFRCHPDEVVR